MRIIRYRRVGNSDAGKSAAERCVFAGGGKSARGAASAFTALR